MKAVEMERQTYKCNVAGCNKEYWSKSGRSRHIMNKHYSKERQFVCGYGCGKGYLTIKSQERHEKTCTLSIPIGQGISSQFYMDDRDIQPHETDIYKVNTAHKGSYKLYRKDLYTKKDFNETIQRVLTREFKSMITAEGKNVKFYMTVNAIFQKALNEDIYTDPPIFFKTTPISSTRATNLDAILNCMAKDLCEQIDDFIRNGSGWILYEIINIDLQIVTYEPLSGSRYLRLPAKLKNSKFILNIKNDDDYCALWSCIAKNFPKYRSGVRRNRRSSLAKDYAEHREQLITTGISWPLQLHEITKLEMLNGLAINVFSFDPQANIIPIRISEQKKITTERTIDLLYMTYSEEKHYCLITNLAKLCRSQKTRHKCSHFICRRCLHFYQTEEKLSSHMMLCEAHEPQKTIFPKKDSPDAKVTFTNIERQLPLPFYIVADFECILEKYDTCLPNPEESNTSAINKHTVCGAAYTICCTDQRFFQEPRLFTREVNGKSITTQFLDSILQDVLELRQTLKYITPMKDLTLEQMAEFNTENIKCHICNKTIPPHAVKVRDHNHLTGDYRGPAHQDCNLNYRIQPDSIQIPCFMHNLKNYDSHLLITAAEKRHGIIKVIPTTTEKYISFSIGDVCFKDSYAFLAASLDELTKTLTLNEFINTRRWLEFWAKQNTNVYDEDSSNPSISESYLSYSNTPIDVSNNNQDDVIVDDYEYCSNEKDNNLTDNDMEMHELNDNIDIEMHELYGDGDDNDNEQCIQMEDFDYRRNPYIVPSLTEEEQSYITEDLKLLTSKGVYPYEYMDSFERFNETVIPPIEAFTSTLHGGKKLSKADYAHALNVFSHFQMESLQDYHNLYLLQDVLMLADVIGTFRRVCLEAYGLDPLHYYTSPGLTWDAGLKYTNASLELITDEDMYLFIESGIRGGISMITHRYAKANHLKYQDEGYYDAALPNQELFYFDANNLYGFGMNSYLPISNFMWRDPDIHYLNNYRISRGNNNNNNTINEYDYSSLVNAWISTLQVDSDRGQIIELDGVFPDEVQERLKNYPLAPERKKIDGTLLSPYQREIIRRRLREQNQELSDNELTKKIDEYISAEKLILDFLPKEKYVVHYRTLQLYISLGFKVTKIHRILEFKQEKWLAPYIESNTVMRQKATSDFEKSFYKLMNNSFFGKTMENVRSRRDIELVTDEKRFKKLVSQPTFKSATVFHENLSAVERMKKKILLNKPIYIGFCVLEVSKWLMFDFYYNILERLFPPQNLQLLFTDTDSLCISVKDCHDAYNVISESTILTDNLELISALDYFDLSAYSSDHHIFKGLKPAEVSTIKKKNKKVPGKMKDELNGNALLEFVGLRAKTYAFKWLTSDNVIAEEKKLKGIQKCVVKSHLTFDHYKSSLFSEKTYIAATCSLRSTLHKIETKAINKVATGPFDDKRFLFADGITSVPYGYYAMDSIYNI